MALNRREEDDEKKAKSHAELYAALYILVAIMCVILLRLYATMTGGSYIALYSVS